MERTEYAPQEHELGFKTPFNEVTLEDFSKEFPEQKEELATVLDEIDRQAVNNFTAFKSKDMPGVAFSYTKMTVTPDLVRKLSRGDIPEIAPQADDESGEEDTKYKKHDYYIFTPFGPPPDGHALTPQDLGIDRFIRLIPRVARPLKHGEEPPEVNVYILGAPTGFGGSVTDKWIDDVKEKGMDAHADLYGEFIKKQEGENDETHIVLQGVSKGAVIAEKASARLPEAVQKRTQRLLDNPAGHHQRGQYIKGAQVAFGLGAETVARMLFDNTMMKPLMRRGGDFLEKLSEKTGIPKDNPEQKKLKLKAALAEGIALVKGSPLDTENVRSFIRKGIEDPLSFSPKNLWDIWQKQKQGTKIPMFSKGKTLETPFEGHHFFYLNRYKRWSKILDYAKGK